MRWYVPTAVAVLLASNAWAIPTPTESRVSVLAFLYATPSGLLLDQAEDATTQATTIDPIVAGAFAAFG